MSASLILASKSPRRQQLLQLLEIPFRVEIADTDEARLPGESPVNLVTRLAQEKAAIVGDREKDTIVIGADTIVVLRGRILEKPANAENAGEMLRSLRGTTHTVYTGVSVRDPQTLLHTGFVEKTLVTFGEISDREINVYISTGSPFDKAGGYGIQDDRGALFVERINGDFYNVMGLPVYRLNQVLHTNFATLFEANQQ